LRIRKTSQDFVFLSTMPQFKIHHVTRYTYEVPVRDSANQIILFPVKDEYQTVLKQDLIITGEPAVDLYKDYYGNEVGSFMFTERHSELKIDSKIEVTTLSRPMPEDSIPKEEQWTSLQAIRHQVPFIDFLKQEPCEVVDEIKRDTHVGQYMQVTPLTTAQKLNEYVYREFQYIKGVTSIETTPDEIWKLKAGVCQDFAHILLVMLRMIGIPARYVSGYICPNRNGMRGEGATHAWVEAYIPNYGWLGLDPTNNCFVNDLHVRLAVGRNFSDCSPVKGTYKGTSNHNLEVGVSVSYEDGHVQDDQATILMPHPITNGGNKSDDNSYRRYMEMIQQQQQQQ
jgi:transglutaminase-like putative cysteine protease